MCDNDAFKPKPFKSKEKIFTSGDRTKDLKSKKIYHGIVVTANNTTECGKNYNGTIVFDKNGNIKQFRNYELAMNTARGSAFISKGCDCEDDEYLESYTPAGSDNSRLAGINRSLRPIYNTPTGEISALCCVEEYTWKVAKISRKQWTSIDMSDDGTIIFASEGNNMRRSFDSGVTWNTILPNTSYRAVTLSSDGKKAAANSGVAGALSSVLYYSLNSSDTSFLTTSINGGPWEKMCSSNDNQRIFVACAYNSTIGGGGCRYSLNYGVTWNYSSGLNSQADWYSIGCNDVGSIVYIGQRTDDPASNDGELWRSTNSGASFSQIPASSGLPVTSSQKWYGIDLSDDGKIVYACDFNVSANGGYIWTSKNYGANFNQLTSAGQKRWSEIKCSSSGQYIIACDKSNVYTSDDYGNTWKQEIFPESHGDNWRSLAISADGKRKAAISYGFLPPPFPIIQQGLLYVFNNVNSSYY